MEINNRLARIVQSRRPVLLHFYAEWCEPCQQLLPSLKAIKDIFKKSIRIIKVNVDHNPAVASQCRVKNLPTLILFQSGTIKWKNEGVLECSELTDILRKFVQSERHQQ